MATEACRVPFSEPFRTYETRQICHRARGRSSGTSASRDTTMSSVFRHDGTGGGADPERAQDSRAKDSLRESDQRFCAMADAAPVMIWMSGVDMLCNFFNEPWLAFTGRTTEQELGNGWAEGVHPDDLQRCLEVYTSSFEARRPFSMEYRLRRADGEYRWILDRGIPRYAPDGGFVGYIGSAVDVTDGKLTEEALRTARAELAHMLSHAQLQGGPERLELLLELTNRMVSTLDLREVLSAATSCARARCRLGGTGRSSRKAHWSPSTGHSPVVCFARARRGSATSMIFSR